MVPTRSQNEAENWNPKGAPDLPFLDIIDHFQKDDLFHNKFPYH